MSDDERAADSLGPYRVGSGTMVSEDPNALPAHHFDVPTSEEDFPDVDPRMWVADTARTNWRGCLRSPVRMHLWSPGKPMGAGDAIRFQSVMGYDFVAEGPQKSVWLGATAGEVFDLSRHVPAGEELRKGPIVVPGARVDIRGLPYVMIVWLEEDGHLAYDFKPYGDVFPEHVRFLFVCAVRP